uniref:Retroviral polymerase SH3-like domain-containing protein n=1 Tax=Strigamia maritima TaxID=126957 RepID=T1J0T4_STRMM
MSLAHLKIPGSLAYVHVPKPSRRDKLESRAWKGVMVGYAMRTRGFRIWDPGSNNVYESKHVKFDETRLYKDVVQTPERDSLFETSVALRSRPDVKAYCETNLKIKYKADDYDFNPTHAVDSDSDDDVEQPKDAEVEPEADNGEAETYSVHVYCAKVQDEEAILSPESDKWKAAMAEELDTLEERSVFEIKPRLSHSHILGNKWIFKLKVLFVRFRARLVAQGFRQIQ